MSKEVEVSKYFKDFKITKAVLTYIFSGTHIKTGLPIIFRINNQNTSIDFLYYERIKDEVAKLNKKEKEDMFNEILEINKGLFLAVKDLD